MQPNVERLHHVSEPFVDRKLWLRESDGEATETLPYYLRHASVVALSDHQIIATTWSGRCLLIDIDTGEVLPQPMVASTREGRLDAGFTLDSPSVKFGDPPVVGVATRASWAGFWPLGATEARKLAPQRSDPVTAVALSPHAAVAAIGLGFYPLSNDRRSAAIELWTLDAEPKLLSSTVLLPDAAVDQLAWDPYRNRLLALSGAVNQDRGHAWVFDGDTLFVRHVVETGGCMYRFAGFVDGGCSIVAISHKTVELHGISRPIKPPRYWTSSGEITGAGICEATSRIFLSTGDIISLDEDMISAFDTIPECVAVAVLPNGGCVALSEAGMLRIWDEIR